MALTALALAAYVLALGACSAIGPSVEPPKPQASAPATLPAPAYASPVQTGQLDQGALAKYRTMQIDPRVEDLSREMAQNASLSSPSRLPAVVALLTGAEPDPFMKVKLIHDWIADTIAYDYQMFARGLAVNQDVESVLSSRKAVCSGYSRLFQRMAELAGIRSDIVSGYAKGLSASYSLDQRSSHSWNIVYIRGGRYLVDTTWDAGSIEKGYFVKSYSTDYLFISPRDNLYSHFPKDPTYQLVDNPIDGSAFLREPDLQGGFFRYGLSLADGGLESRTSTSGRYTLEIRSERPEVRIDASVKDSKEREVESATFVTRSGPTTWRVVFAFPAKGSYRGLVYAGLGKSPEGSGPDTLESVMSVDFENSVPYGAGRAFPRTYASYVESYGEELLSPLKGTLKAGDTQHFEYRSSTAKDVALIADKKFFPLKSLGKGLFSLDFTVPHTKELTLGVSEGGTKYWITVGWDVSP